jgi:hypothetical protein
MRSLPRPLILVLAALCLPAAGFAVDLVVTRYDDPVPGGCDNLGPHETWDCSLREAVIASVALPTDDRILLSAGTYELTRAGANEDDGLTGDLDVLGNLEILGPGATMTVIDANGLDRIFEIDDSAAAGDDVVRISGVTLTGGVTPDQAAGAAIHVARVDLTIDRCEITGNGPVNAGGTVFAMLFADLSIRESSIHDNADVGVKLLQALGAFTNVTFSNNVNSELWVGTDATALCNHCTIRDDEAADEVSLSGATSILQLAGSVVIGDCLKFAGATEIDSLGGNLESPGATCDLGSGDLENVANHGLGSLGLNGGPTSAHVPGVTSPVLGLATSLFCAPTDQRGVVRDENSCDAGSVERTTVRPPIPIFADGFLQGDADAWSSVVAD